MAAGRGGQPINMRSADPTVRRPPHVRKTTRTQLDFELSRSAARASATFAGAGSSAALAGGVLAAGTLADGVFAAGALAGGMLGLGDGTLAATLIADGAFAAGPVAAGAVAAGAVAAGAVADGTLAARPIADGRFADVVSFVDRSGRASSVLAAGPASTVALAAAARPGSATWTNGSSSALAASG